MRVEAVKDIFWRYIFCCCLLVIASCRCFAQEISPESGANPALVKFNAAITFYASFDGYAVADLSLGSGEPLKTPPDLVWEKGIHGQALRAQGLEYASAGNVDLNKMGSVAFWIKPVNWQRPSDPNYLFFVRAYDNGKLLTVARMGAKVNREKLYISLKIGDKTTLMGRGSSQNWNDEWHLLAANWSAGYMEFSVDGSPFLRDPLPQNPPSVQGNINKLQIATGGGGDYPYLMDELFVLNRPLSDAEVEWLYQLGQ